MTFDTIVKHLVNGRKITRENYARILGNDTYYQNVDGELIYYSGIERHSVKLIPMPHILADDWMVLDD